MIDVNNELELINTSHEGDFESMRDNLTADVTEDLDEVADNLLFALEEMKEKRNKRKLNTDRVRSEPLPDEGIFVEAVNIDGASEFMIRVLNMKGILVHAQRSQYENVFSAAAEAVLVGMKQTGGETVFVNSGLPSIWMRSVKGIKDPVIASEVEDIMMTVVEHQGDTSAKLRVWNTYAWGEPAGVEPENILEMVGSYEELLVANGQEVPKLRAVSPGRAF